MATRLASSPSEREVFLALLRAGDHLSRGLEKLLGQKPACLSLTQHHVLEILRQSHQDVTGGLACHEIARRMITRDPDITRLLDRLEKRGLITRSRGPGDRRIVLAAITATGLEILAPLDEPLRAFYRQQLAGLGAEGLRKLAELLGQLRGPTQLSGGGDV